MCVLTSPLGTTFTPEKGAVEGAGTGTGGDSDKWYSSCSGVLRFLTVIQPNHSYSLEASINGAAVEIIGGNQVTKKAKLLVAPWCLISIHFHVFLWSGIPIATSLVMCLVIVQYPIPPSNQAKLKHKQLTKNENELTWGFRGQRKLLYCVSALLTTSASSKQPISDSVRLVTPRFLSMLVKLQAASTAKLSEIESCQAKKLL